MFHQRSVDTREGDRDCCLHVQIRLMGNFGLNGRIPWITNTDGALCFVCKRDNETLGYFLFGCPNFREHLTHFGQTFAPKVTTSNPLDGRHVAGFLMNLYLHHKVMVFLGCLPLPFDSLTLTVINRFITSAIGKTYKLHTENCMANKIN